MENTKQTKEKSGFKKVLSTPYLIMFGLAYLAPTVVFNYYGIMTEMTKGMMAIAYGITTIVMLFTAFSYARMVEVFPVAGSSYTYVKNAINPYIGFLTGWVTLLDYLLVPMISYLLLGIYVNEYFPQLPIWLVVVIAACISAFINILGVKTAGKVNTIIIGGQIAFTLLLIILIVKFVSGGGGEGTLFSATAIYAPEHFNAGSILTAASILCVSFLGFDAVSTLAEETINPEKTIGKAIIGVCVGAGIAFFVISYFTQIAWPTAYTDIKDVDSGIFELLARINADFMPDVFFVVDNLASFVCAMAGLAAVSRVLYGMGKDGLLPKRFFGKLSPKYQTPVNNIILTSLIALTALFYQENLLGAVSLISFGAISAFFLVNLSVIFHYYIKNNRRKGMDFIKYFLMPSIGMLVSAILWINIEASAKILGCVWLLIGVIYCAAKTGFFRKLPPEMDISEKE